MATVRELLDDDEYQKITKILGDTDTLSPMGKSIVCQICAAAWIQSAVDRASLMMPVEGETVN